MNAQSSSTQIAAPTAPSTKKASSKKSTSSSTSTSTKSNKKGAASTTSGGMQLPIQQSSIPVKAPLPPTQSYLPSQTPSTSSSAFPANWPTHLDYSAASSYSSKMMPSMPPGMLHAMDPYAAWNGTASTNSTLKLDVPLPTATTSSSSSRKHSSVSNNAAALNVQSNSLYAQSYQQLKSNVVDHHSRLYQHHQQQYQHLNDSYLKTSGKI